MRCKSLQTCDVRRETVQACLGSNENRSRCKACVPRDVRVAGRPQCTTAGLCLLFTDGSLAYVLHTLVGELLLRAPYLMNPGETGERNQLNHVTTVRLTTCKMLQARKNIRSGHTVTLTHLPLHPRLLPVSRGDA